MNITDLGTEQSHTTAATRRERLLPRWPPWLGRVFGQGIRQKLVLVSLLILIVVSFGFLLLHRLVASTWIDEDLRDRAIIFAQEISATIRDSHEFDSGPALEGDIRRIMAVRSNVQQLDILKFTPDGTDIVASSHPYVRLPFSHEDGRRVRRGKVVSKLADVNGSRAWDTLVPITVDGQVIGAVATRFSLDSADRLSFRINFWALIFTGVSVLLMGYLMALAVTYTVNRPIASFLGAIGQIRDSGATARVQVQTGDEFELLASHFNEMMARINSFNEELDERIRSATRQLDDKYHELQRLNQVLYTTQRHLSQAERLAVAGQMVAQVAHEIGTPLHSVAGHLELLRADLPTDVAHSAARRLEIIESQVTRVSSVIRQLLDLVRRDRAIFSAVDVGELVRASADLFSPGMAAANLMLHVEVEEGLPPAKGNREQLMQVLLNLLANAVDATPAGGGINIKARARNARELEICVHDTGSGIPAALREEIFQPFVSSKPHGKGTGLGLYIAAQIVRDHGGRIVVDSTEGRGTSVTVVLSVWGDSP